MDALRAARVPCWARDPEPLPYLRGEPPTTVRPRHTGLDIDYEVEWNGTVVSRPPYRTMYWSPAQMLAHLTVNGATIRPGDLFGSSTISGPEKAQRILPRVVVERSGADPLDDGSTRAFLEDGDTVVLRAVAPGPRAQSSGLASAQARSRQLASSPLLVTDDNLSVGHLVVQGPVDAGHSAATAGRPRSPRGRRNR